jgi:uncharacterized protein YjdB
MLKSKRNLQICAAFAALILLAVSIGCSGFFVDPTLTTITVTPPTPSVVVGNTQQMTATGTYDDGSSKNITGTVAWTTSDPTIATVGASSGLLTGVATGSATITASEAAITGSTSATVQVAGLQSITVTPSNTSVTSGSPQQFTAMGHLQNGTTQDISTSATWTSSNTSAATIDSTGLVTTLSVTVPTTVTITATSGTVFGTATLTVNP